MSMPERRRVSKVCGQATSARRSSRLRAQRTANEPTWSHAYSGLH
jgi:hypothetical protein